LTSADLAPSPGRGYHLGVDLPQTLIDLQQAAKRRLSDEAED